jgi:hypothetical protein
MTCCCCYDLIIGGDTWVSYVFVFEKCFARDASYLCADRPKFLTLVVFSGRAQHKSLAAVFSKSLTFVGFVMNHCFHANRDKWVFVIVMLFIEVCICG